MTPPATQPTTAPETPVSGAVRIPEVLDFIQVLQHVLATEGAWDTRLTQERLFDLLSLAVVDYMKGVNP